MQHSRSSDAESAFKRTLDQILSVGNEIVPEGTRVSSSSVQWNPSYAAPFPDPMNPREDDYLLWSAFTFSVFARDRVALDDAIDLIREGLASVFTKRFVVKTPELPKGP